jgi:hypothetical protein
MSKGPKKYKSLIELLLNECVIYWQISKAKMRPQRVVASNKADHDLKLLQGVIYLLWN